MSRRVGTSVLAAVIGVSARSVQRYCEDGVIPPAHCHRTRGATGHWRIDLEIGPRIRKWLVDEREQRDHG